MRKPGYAGVPHLGADREGESPASVVVRMTIPGVNRNIQEVLPFDQVHPLQQHRHLPRVFERREDEIVNRRVRSVHREAVFAEDPDSEDGIADRRMNLVAKDNLKGFATLEEVAFLTQTIVEED